MVDTERCYGPGWLHTDDDDELCCRETALQTGHTSAYGDTPFSAVD